jgi:predicted Rossmann fold nucleotide-binding protein DprA/Smf involved in DNA uptake
MTPTLSPNTQAILLLTAPLIAGRSVISPDLLSPGEYKRLARHLLEIQRQPADLISPDAVEILHSCHPVIDESRLQRLLGRGFLLSQVIEHWQARAIWVVSRADADYPRRLKTRLREDAPAVLYGCGDKGLLENGGLAVVGSRRVDDSLIDYTMSVGSLAARAGRTIVSGGAKGIDQAAMRGAVEAGGKVCGVLADRLEKTTMNREHRNLLLDGFLVLISPYDPSAGFNVGNAMQRNKLIYALADASLVVNSDLKKGGTWSGAVEQLDRFKFVPVFIRSTGRPCPAFDALREKGAIPWPNPKDPDSFEAIFNASFPLNEHPARTQLSLLEKLSSSTHSKDFQQVETVALDQSDEAPSTQLKDSTMEQESGESQDGSSAVPQGDKAQPPEGLVENIHDPDITPAEMLFSAVRQSMQKILLRPKKDTEVAAALDVSNSQAKAWLLRLVEDGMVEKTTRPVQYVLRKPDLFSRN